MKKKNQLHELLDGNWTTSVRGSEGPSLLITTYFPFGLKLALKYVCFTPIRVILHVRQRFELVSFA